MLNKAQSETEDAQLSQGIQSGILYLHIDIRSKRHQIIHNLNIVFKHSTV